ncbi:LOW QUALITY PROTEIN: protein mono-ADP-ribosyltransferase PARP14-like [Colossoma macropomum]|uniref:LOW QUALITY PROTEIN: protein mono-ADP-ribosyltransferase PARP14-like n=1 Tax=Colossoma macropomum TaxID=42526 RepID=UPI0018651A1B|nr:LOW QUALITY PROTEIN: protein mono-ADP-ribosyltransferase PARP14-like [Colossoma macropomum]
MEEYLHPISVEAVEGRWPSASTRTLTAKLQIYFQSRKKSQGGDCVVSFSEDSSAATVLFRSAQTRDQVLAKGDHSITIENQLVKLKVFKPGDEGNQTAETSRAAGAGSAMAVDLQQPGSISEWTDQEVRMGSVSLPPNVSPDGIQSDPAEESLKDCLEDPPQSNNVALEKLPDSFSKDVLVLLLEKISGVPEKEFTLELIRESNIAVVIFNDLEVAEKFLMESRSHKKFQQYGVRARALEKRRSVKVENVHGEISADLLEVYFEKCIGAVEKVTMIPEEQAAIVTFHSEEDVKKVLGKRCIINRIVYIYPYFISLGTALYGKDRPTWALPKPFTEKIHPAIREFLNKKGLISSICQEMISLFCHVNMDKAEVQLSPHFTLLKQKGITKSHIIDTWKKNATDGFRKILSSYAVFEHQVIPSVWSAVEKDIWSVVKDNASVRMSDGVLAVAGMAQDIKLLTPILKNLLETASDQVERDKNGISETFEVPPAMFSLLLQEGLQSRAAAKYPKLELAYKKDTNQLTLRGLPVEIINIKSHVLERKLNMKQKILKMDASLLEFLRSVDCEVMSGDLFTSKGISAVCTVENGDVVLTGSSDRSLTVAEKALQTALASSTLSLEDLGVLEKPEWRSLNDQLCETYNSSKKTVIVKPSEQKDRLVVFGFQQPVLEVNKSLKKFINTRSRIERVIQVKSCAVVKFIDEKKAPAWQKFVKPNEVTVHFDQKTPSIRLSGERVHVQPAVENFQKIADALHTDRLTIKKAGAKKYFQEHGSMFLVLIKEHRFVVVFDERPGSTTKEGHAIQEKAPVVRSSASPEPSANEDFVKVGEEFEPAVFQLCGETQQDLNEARELINSFLVKEQTSSSIQDPSINYFTREDAKMLTNLQRELTVSIRLKKNGPELVIIVEGLIRDVVKAESAIRDMIRKVEKNEAQKREVFMVTSFVEWQYLDSANQLVPFDILTNYDLEEAFVLKQSGLKIRINNEEFEVDLTQRVAVGKSERIELKRVDRRDDSSVPLPGHWEDMTGSFVKRVQIQQGSQEYTDVENEFRRTGLNSKILNIERVQNSTLWRSFTIQKNHLDDKNKHRNNERRLFHGTGSDKIDKINHQGFNRSYAGTHGAAYGNGVYFAVDPSYSARGYSKPDQQGHKHMYLARVLVGDFTTGKSGLLLPPAKSSTATDLYDSVTDNQQNPTIFVIFHDVQAYPEYLITFQ